MMWPVKDTRMYNEDTVIAEICFLSKSQIQQYNFYHASWQLYGDSKAAAHKRSSQMYL